MRRWLPGDFTRVRSVWRSGCVRTNPTPAQMPSCPVRSQSHGAQGHFAAYFEAKAALERVYLPGWLWHDDLIQIYPASVLSRQHMCTAPCPGTFAKRVVGSPCTKSGSIQLPGFAHVTPANWNYSRQTAYSLHSVSPSLVIMQPKSRSLAPERSSGRSSLPRTRHPRAAARSGSTQGWCQALG